MFCCTETEFALKKRFEDAYRRSRVPVIQEIERKVCGCDYGGNSGPVTELFRSFICILCLKGETTWQYNIQQNLDKKRCALH